LEDGDNIRAALPAIQNDSLTPLLNDDSMRVTYTHTDIDRTGAEDSNSVGGVMEATHSIQVSPQKCTDMPLNVHGKALLRNLDFFMRRVTIIPGVSSAD